MTFSTNRNYVQPMLGRITFVMMVKLCLLTTRTLQEIKMEYFTSCNSTLYSYFSCDYFRVPFFVFNIGTALVCFALLTLIITFSSGFAFFCLKISLFCLNCFRHRFLLYEKYKLCLIKKHSFLGGGGLLFLQRSHRSP